MPTRHLEVAIWLRRLAVVGGLAALSACATAPGPAPRVATGAAGLGAGVGGTMRPYVVDGVLYTPHADPHYDAVGVATWYGYPYHKRATADGELFDMDKPSAAHTTLPLPCIVEVTNLENGRRIRVRVNDRGPFVKGRIIDLSREAAKELGFYTQGSTRVRVRYIGPAPLQRGGSLQLASAAPQGAVQTAPEVRHSRPAVVRAAYSPPAPEGSDQGQTPPSLGADDPMIPGGAVQAPHSAPASAPISEGSLPPIGPADAASSAPGPQPAVATPAATPSAPATLTSMPPVAATVRVQAGAFADPANARAAAQTLGRFGAVSLEPVTRGDQTLWRVVVAAPPGENGPTLAGALAGAGFPGARLLP